MPAHFDLIITADYPTRTAEFYLRDTTGVQVAYRKTDFKNISVSHQQGLFDLRNYLRLYVEAGKESAAVAEIGVCIAEEVLGEEIFTKLWESKSQRTLRIELPGAEDTENHLAAALARVPWEIARPSPDGETLAERNLLVRFVHDMQAPASTPIELAADEPLRVLFVFAESRGSRPLGARKERRELLRLFEKEIYLQRRVVAHFLTHGVTRERLSAQIQENGGYHVVHWSGHGHRNLLELCKPGGEPDHLSGAELLDLFSDAGGFLPRLFFLSACHSGDILRVKNWADFLAVAQGKEPGTKEAGTKDLDLKEQPGYTGTAHALLQGGVPSVVAMRYAVGDDYAREAAVEFYRALLAHAQPKHVAAALTMARQTMLDPKKHDPARFSVCDHATPVLYGAEHPGLTLAKGRSPALNSRNPRLHSITELTMTGHEHFVGRTWELVGLGADFIGSSTGSEVRPVAVITGLGGMGKTALTAEALALWESRFEWVLLYQAKPNRLEFEATLRDIHMKLVGELKLYHDHVRANPADAIYRDANPASGFTGPARLQRLTQNLLRALKDEPILIVLDNFETNLKDADPATQLSACQDSAWNECLALLAEELIGTSSRVLITCRRPLAALAGGPAHSVRLGPLPSSEAALYLKEQPTLGRMIFGIDQAEKALAMRLLNATRFHPLLMDRLAKLAAHTPPRTQLLAALDTLEKTKDFSQLPALFAVKPGDAKELAYLDDALASSLDQLIRASSPDARRLLWIIAVANQPEAFGLVKSVWDGESLQQERLRQIKQRLDMLPMLPHEEQARLQAMPPELRAMLDALPPKGPTKPDVTPLLAQLVSVGLVTEEGKAPNCADRNLTCHELIRERIRAWMEQHPQDRAELTVNAIRLAYAERLEAIFQAFRHKNMALALKVGIRALIYCVQAEEWERLFGFVGGLVISISDRQQLDRLLPFLQGAVESAPEGKTRWRCLLYLADALDNAGQHDASLLFFESAAGLARSTAESGDESASAWSDLATILGNWGVALSRCGQLELSRQRQLEAAQAHRKVGDPAIDVIGRELEAYRIEVMMGNSKAALPQIEPLVQQLADWWELGRSGGYVPESPDIHKLGHVLLSAYQLAAECYSAMQMWDSALSRFDAALMLTTELGFATLEACFYRMNRANVLNQLGRVGEAKGDLEQCLVVFQKDPFMSAKVHASLADIFEAQGDVTQSVAQYRRALALLYHSPNPKDRALLHGNFAPILAKVGTASALSEAACHALAALIYRLVAKLGQHLESSLHYYLINFKDASAGISVPRVATVLSDPAFAPLEQWLRQRGVDLDELQAAVDQFLGQIRQIAIPQ